MIFDIRIRKDLDEFLSNLRTAGRGYLEEAMLLEGLDIKTRVHIEMFAELGKVFRLHESLSASFSELFLV